jgi:hypothetical protein
MVRVNSPLFVQMPSTDPSKELGHFFTFRSRLAKYRAARDASTPPPESTLEDILWRQLLEAYSNGDILDTDAAALEQLATCLEVTVLETIDHLKLHKWWTPGIPMFWTNKLASNEHDLDQVLESLHVLWEQEDRDATMVAERRAEGSHVWKLVAPGVHEEKIVEGPAPVGPTTAADTMVDDSAAESDCEIVFTGRQRRLRD